MQVRQAQAKDSLSLVGPSRQDVTGWMEEALAFEEQYHDNTHYTIYKHCRDPQNVWQCLTSHVAFITQHQNLPLCRLLEQMLISFSASDNLETGGP